MSEKVFAKVSKVFAEKNDNKYTCESCHYTCCKKDSYTKHLISAKHKNSEKCEKVFAKVSEQYVCEKCNYICYIKSNYTKHLNTLKHKNRNIVKHDIAVSSDNIPDTEQYTIPENTPQTTASTLVLDSSLNEIKILTGLIVELVKSNNDLQKQVIEMCQKMQPVNSNNVINSHNKTFNLQFFLNEECKDAMNLSEFVNSIQLKLSDLENIGKLGYVEGISNIIIKELNDTEINKRPVHCSDVKRETLYVKEENKWEKETEDTKNMIKAVRDVDKKASRLLITEWKDMNPDCTNSKSKQSETFVSLVGEISDCGETNVKKVIKKVAKEVAIDK